MTETVSQTPQKTTAAVDSNTVKKEPPSPKGWIRWSGFLVFAAVIAVVVGLSYLGVTVFLKNQLETYGSKAWGAKIDIGSLDIGLFPIRVGLNQLDVTDPDHPMKNMVEIGRMGASLNFYHWVAGRTVIEDLRVQGLAFDQPRKTSGALPETEQKKSKTASQAGMFESFEVPKILIPDATKILDRTNLKTLQTAEALQAEIEQVQQDWQSLESKLPTEKQINDYQKRFEALTKGEIKTPADVEAKRKALESLQKDVEVHKDAIDKARTLFEKRLPALKKQAAALKDMPAEDFNRLKSMYGLDEKGFSNLTYLLYGPKIQSYLNTGLKWYETAKPFIDRVDHYLAEKKADEKKAPERATGQTIKFREYDPQPEFIIKRSFVSGTIDWGRLLIDVRKLTFNQAETKIPVTFHAQLQPEGQETALRIDGKSDFTQPKQGVNEADFHWKGYEVKNWSLIKDDTLPIRIDKALADLNGQLTITNHNKIHADIALAYQNVDFDLSATKSKEVKKYMVPIFEDIHAFTVNSDIRGDLFAPALGAKSNLDQKLSGAFNKVLNQTLAEEKAKLKVRFDQEVSKALKPVNTQLAQLSGEQARVNSDAKDINDILSFDVDSLVEQQKKQLQKQAEQEAKKRLDKEAGKLIKGLGF